MSSGRCAEVAYTRRTERRMTEGRREGMAKGKSMRRETKKPKKKK
jgi:hypothetical protein